MPAPAGYTMHDSGYWFKTSDLSGPYVFDGSTMYLVSALILGSTGPAVAASSGAVANAAAVATLAAAAGKTNFLSGLTITGAGSTLGSVVQALVTGLAVPDLKYAVVAPAGLVAPIAPINVRFDPPIPASAANVAITLTVPAVGLGNTLVVANIHGYQK